jgi:predicted SprT family Zn-dependent metalloprotease
LPRREWSLERHEHVTERNEHVTGETGDPNRGTSAESIVDRVRRYARTVEVDVDLSTVSWELSERAKRRAGVCLFDRQTGLVTIRLARGAYEKFDWDEFAAVVRHELVHAWEFQQYGESGHGDRFERKAAALDVPRHCPPFTAGRLRLVCTNDACSWELDRHRASASVTRPGTRRCGDCGAPYLVEHVATGVRWHTASGYETARERIDDW